MFYLYAKFEDVSCLVKTGRATSSYTKAKARALRLKALECDIRQRHPDGKETLEAVVTFNSEFDGTPYPMIYERSDVCPTAH